MYTHTYTTTSTFNGQTQMKSSLFLAGLKLSSFSEALEQVSISNIFWVCVPLLSYFLLMFFVSWAIARYILSGLAARGWHIKTRSLWWASEMKLGRWKLGDDQRNEHCCCVSRTCWEFRDDEQTLVVLKFKTVNYTFFSSLVKMMFFWIDSYFCMSCLNSDSEFCHGKSWKADMGLSGFQTWTMMIYLPNPWGYHVTHLWMSRTLSIGEKGNIYRKHLQVSWWNMGGSGSSPPLNRSTDNQTISAWSI